MRPHPLEHLLVPGELHIFLGRRESIHAEFGEHLSRVVVTQGKEAGAE